MTDQLSVVNQALAHLDQDATATVDLEDEEIRTAVVKVMAHAEAARDAVLAAAPWTDAMAYVELTRTPDPDDEIATWRWPYVFDLPADALAVWMVGDPAVTATGALRWTKGVRRDDEDVERKVIWSAEPGPLPVGYTQRIAWASLSPSLADAIAVELAARACRPLTGDMAKAQALRQEAERLKRIARGHDGMQEGGMEPMFASATQALRAGAF